MKANAGDTFLKNSPTRKPTHGNEQDLGGPTEVIVKTAVVADNCFKSHLWQSKYSCLSAAEDR